MRGNQRWTVEETRQLRAMKAEGYRFEAIAEKIGRSYYAVSERWRWINKDPGDKWGPYHGAHTIVAHRPEQTLFAERDARIATPRTLTGEFFGDPPPGYSALDRKRQGLAI